MARPIARSRRTCACWMRAMAGARHRWQMARATASAASAGRGGASSLRMRITICPTCALSARPLPVMDALTSVGVCWATCRPARVPTSSTTPEACAVPMIELTSRRANTRSTAIASGRYSARYCTRLRSRLARRCPVSISAGVRTTSASSSAGVRPGSPSMMPTPQRVRPGSIPSTRILLPELVEGPNVCSDPSLRRRGIRGSRPARPHCCRRPRRRRPPRSRRGA